MSRVIFFQVVVNDKLYALCSKVITLRRSKERRICFFTTTQPPTAEPHLLYTIRGELSVGWQVIIARSATELLGCSLAEAAQLAGGLKAHAEGLGKYQAKQVVALIQAALEKDA